MSESEIAQEIVELGFVPRTSAGGEPAPTSWADRITEFPEPVASALAKARDTARPVFIDFYAEWCAPCKIIESKTLPDSRVQAALDGFVFVRVDVDVDLKTGERFDVVAMPTLLVLSGEGEELFRHAGMIDPADLAERLLEIRATRRAESSRRSRDEPERW